MPAKLREQDMIDPDELCGDWARIWTAVPYKDLVTATLAIRQKEAAAGVVTGGAIADKIKTE